MASTWTNIQNNEVASSVRLKINTLGANYAASTKTIDTMNSSITTINSDISTINTQINTLKTLSGMVGISTNIACAASAWAKDTSATYADYKYKATITISGVTSAMVPFVNYDKAQQESGIFTGVESGTNSVVLYAKEQPTADFTIPNIVFIKAVAV